MRLQGDWTKFPADFAFAWDSSDTDASQATDYSGPSSMCEERQVMDPQKEIIPPLPIKLGLMQQFVTALDKKSVAFEYQHDYFQKLSEAKIRTTGVLVGPQIRKSWNAKNSPKS